MICIYCGGVVQWQGPLSELTHTKCLSCGETNCQQISTEENEDEEKIEGRFGNSLIIYSTPIRSERPTDRLGPVNFKVEQYPWMKDVLQW